MTDQLIADIEEAAHSGAHGAGCKCPTEKQHAAGNYKKGRVTIHGLPVVIEQPCYSVRSGEDKGGNRWSCTMFAHYGYFAGVMGADGDELDVFIGPSPYSEHIFIINQVLDGTFDEHKVMLGFDTEEQARTAYLQSYARDWNGLGTVVPTSLSKFKQWIARDIPARAATRADFDNKGLPMQKRIFWNTEANPVGATLDAVLYGLRKGAEEDDMVTAMTLDDVMADADEEVVFDSLVMTYNQMEQKMGVVARLMDRTGSELKVASTEISQPFTSAGSANVAAVFTLSDGQSVTVYMHNPDTTPKKIQPTDEVVSWKWLLNRTDITIAVAPERGTDLNIREVGRRIMRLAEKNMTRFAKAQEKAAATRKMIEDAEAANEQLEAELTEAKAELATLQARQSQYQAELRSSGAADVLSMMKNANANAALGKAPDQGMFVALSHAPGYLGNGKEGYEGYATPPEDDGAVRYVPVSTMKEAADIVRGFIDRNGLGASNFKGGQVYKDGVQIAHISYNGRAWTGTDPFAKDKQEIDISPDALVRKKVESALIGAGWVKDEGGAFRRTLTSEGESLEVRVAYEGGEIRAYEGDAVGQIAFVTFPDGDKSADAAVAELFGLVDDELEAKIERKASLMSREEVLTAEGYAKLVDADALDDYADILDSAFSERIQAVRERLLAIGWEKFSSSSAWPLQNGSKRVNPEFKLNSSGTNNVGVTYALQSFDVKDDFADAPEVLADRIHKLAGFETPDPDSLLSAGVRLANLLKGLGWEYSVDAENPNIITASYGDTLGAFSVEIEDDNGKLLVDGDEINALSLTAYAADLHEEMMGDGLSDLYEMYGVSADENASNYRDEGFVKALHMAVELIKRKGGRVNFGNFDASLSGSLFDAVELPAKARIIAQIVDVQTSEPVGRLAVDGDAITIYRGLSGDQTVIDESRRITDVGEALDGLLSGTKEPSDAEAIEFPKENPNQEREGWITQFFRLAKGKYAPVAGIPDVSEFEMTEAEYEAGGRLTKTTTWVDENGNGYERRYIKPLEGENVHDFNRKPFMHAGLKIYPLHGKFAWSVQSLENQELEKNGEVRMFGDTLHETVEEAKAEAEFQQRKNEENAAHKETLAAEKAEEEARIAAIEADTFSGFLSDDLKANQKALIRKNLNKSIRLSGELTTAREFIDKHYAAGTLTIETTTEKKIKDPTKARYFRMNLDEQRDFEQRQKEAGTKTVYWVNNYDLGKTAYSYAAHLLSSSADSEGIDDGYQFADMPAEFREWLVSSSGEIFNPYATAKAMDEAAKEVGLSIKWGFFAGPALDSVTVDSVDDDGYQGKVYRGGKLIGRIDLGGDGKAMVFIGKAGNRRPKTSLGNDFSYSAGDAPNMIKALAEQAGYNLDPNGDPLESDSSDELTDNELKAKGQEALQSLIDGKFISRMQAKTIDGMISRSEEWRFFADKMIELKERIDTMAKTYEQEDGKGMNATAYLHYFGGSYDAYITEKDMEGGVDQAFGWASFGQGGELGYISIAEIVKNPTIELDLHFDPKTLNQALGRNEETETEAEAEESTMTIDAIIADIKEKLEMNYWDITDSSATEFSASQIFKGLAPATVATPDGERRIKISVNATRARAYLGDATIYEEALSTDSEGFFVVRKMVDAVDEFVANKQAAQAKDDEFKPGEKLYYRSIATGYDEPVEFRGLNESGQAVIVENGIQMVMPVGDLKRTPELVFAGDRNPEPAPEIQPEPAPSSPDNDYLNKVIAGELDLTDTAVIEEVEAIAERVAGDSEMEEKLTSAIDVIQNAMMNATDNL